MDKSQKEVRSFAGTFIRSMDEYDEVKVSGIAVKYNSDSEDMGFVEQIAPSALTDALKDSNVRLLYNHNTENLLAREKAGTLELRDTVEGLEFTASLATDTELSRQVQSSIKRNDLSGMSFGFTVEDDVWNEVDGIIRRTITKIGELFEISFVTFPAYKSTEVSMRSFEQFKEKIKGDNFKPDFSKYEERLKQITNK